MAECGKKQDPSGVGLLGDEYFAGLKIGIVGICNDASATANNSRAAADSLKGVTIGSVRLWGLFGLEIVA